MPVLEPIEKSEVEGMPPTLKVSLELAVFGGSPSVAYNER